MKRLGAVLAGGASTRFGSDKALATWRGKRLIDHAFDTLRPHVDALVVVGRDDPGRASLADRPAPGLGPLGGLCAALHHGAAVGCTTVLTSGCDLLDVPLDFAARLGDAPAVARGQPLLGIWPTALADALAAHLARGDRSMRGWVAAAGAREVDIGDIRNVNRVSDLGEDPADDRRLRPRPAS